MDKNNECLTSDERNNYEQALNEVKAYLDILLSNFCKERGIAVITSGRIKSNDSIEAKINKKKEKKGNISIKEDICDIAGFRVVFCAAYLEGLNMSNVNSFIYIVTKEKFVELMNLLSNCVENCDIDIIFDFVNYIKNNSNFEIVEEINYIEKPKDSGYQSFHLVVLTSNGYKVEIQIRNILQHLWAECEHRKVYKNTVSDSINTSNISSSTNEEIDFKEFAVFVKESGNSKERNGKVLSRFKAV